MGGGGERRGGEAAKERGHEADDSQELENEARSHRRKNRRGERGGRHESDATASGREHRCHWWGAATPTRKVRAAARMSGHMARTSKADAISPRAPRQSLACSS